MKRLLSLLGPFLGLVLVAPGGLGFLPGLVPVALPAELPGRRLKVGAMLKESINGEGRIRFVHFKGGRVR